MHWTAFLARRHFPRRARVIADLHCIGCGYNVRGLLVSARCPECARPVEDSLFVLPRPDVVSRALRGLAVGDLFYLAMPFLSLMMLARWAPLVVGLVFVMGAAWRAFMCFDLRFHAELDQAHIIGVRVRALWFAAVIETITALAFAGLEAASLYAPARNAAAIADAAHLTLGAAIAASLAMLLTLGWFGRGFGMRLSSTFIIVESTALMAIAAFWGVLGVCVAITITWMNAPTLLRLIVVLVTLVLLLLVGTVFLACEHMANFADQERGFDEDAVDTPGFEAPE